MPIQPTDSLLVRRTGTNYKAEASRAPTLLDTDELVVNRGGVSYRLSGAALKAGTFLDTDLFLVNRGGVDYRAPGSEIRPLLSVNKAPVISSVVLSELNAANGIAYTGQSFTTTITMTEDGVPPSTKALKGYVEAPGGGTRRYLLFNAGGNITDMQAADPGFVTTTNQTAPALTFPSTFPTGNAPDVELPAGTTITTVVQAVNTAGSVTMTSNTVTPSRKLTMGQAHAGGYYFGQINQPAGEINFDTGDPYPVDTIYNLIVATKTGGEDIDVAYKTTNTAEADFALAQSRHDGKRTTYTYDDVEHPAFHFARSLSLGGATDWYIGAVDELEILYRHLKSSTAQNDINVGQNQYAVPPTFNYQKLSPSQTTVLIFRTGGSEAFKPSAYVTASQTNASQAWAIKLGNDGAQTPINKVNTEAVRVIRRELA